MLEALADDDTDNETQNDDTGDGGTRAAAAASPAAPPANGRSTSGSLNIGSLRGESQDE